MADVKKADYTAWAVDRKTADDFYEWLDSVCEAGARASDPCLIMAERRKGDRALLALTTPKHMLDMVNFVSYWLPRETFERLKRERQVNIVPVQAAESS